MTGDVPLGYQSELPVRGIVPGYAGFVPASRDHFGGSSYGGGPLSKPDYSQSSGHTAGPTGVWPPVS